MRANTLAALSVSLAILNGCASTSDGYAVHPVPTEPKFISATLYDKFKAALKAPPAAGTAAQEADEKALLEIQNQRTAADCERAASEVKLSLQSFFGAPNGPLKEEEIPKLESFFSQIRNDTDYFIQRLKKDFPRPRPFLYVKGLAPCVLKESTQAYPSGHATIARVQARILAMLYPDRIEGFLARARTIGQDRILGGVHHPSDVKAGEALGDAVYEALKKSKSYAEALAELKKK